MAVAGAEMIGVGVFEMRGEIEGNTATGTTDDVGGCKAVATEVGKPEGSSDDGSLDIRLGRDGNGGREGS